MIAAGTPLRQVTTPEEMADAVVMLLSPLARGITGQNLVVDGGLWHSPKPLDTLRSERLRLNS